MTIGYLDDSYLSDIADAIRAKTGDSASMTVAEMPDEIASISGGGLSPDLEKFLAIRFGMGSLPSGTLYSMDVPYYTDGNNNKVIGERAMSDFGVPYGYSTQDVVVGVLTIPVGVSSIGNNAFCNARCNKLVLPASVTQINDSAFYSMNNGRTSYAGTEVDMSACTNLSLGESVFSNAILETVKLPPNMSSLGLSTFSGSKIQYITLPSNVITLWGRTFYGCSKLVSVSGLENIKTITNNCFENCSKLALSDFEFTNLRTLTGTTQFRGCSAMSGGLSFPALTGTVPGTCFRECSGVTSFDFGEGVTAIGSTAFHSCTALTHVILRNTNAMVTLAATNSFSGCSNLTNIYVPDALVETYKTATNWSTYADKITALSQLPTT